MAHRLHLFLTIRLLRADMKAKSVSSADLKKYGRQKAVAMNQGGKKAVPSKGSVPMKGKDKK